MHISFEAEFRKTQPRDFFNFHYRVMIHQNTLSGAYEPLKATKEHETCTICQVPLQSKFIAKCFPYKEVKSCYLKLYMEHA